MGHVQAPLSTYRVQLIGAHAFERLGALAPYLAKLGISHAYLSPILQAAPGSTHGYDIVDHSLISKDLGGEDAFRRAVAELHAHDIKVVLDIVPNHMALPVPEYLNSAMWSLLRDGPESPYSSWFDLPEGQEIVLPILGQRIDQCIDDDELTISDDGGPDGGPVLRYYEHVVPLRPGTERLALEELLARQHYRLAYWKVASEELNYRRFFDVDTLVAVRVENVEVFTDSHAVIVRLMTEGLVQGLRVDHPDGLADPIGYLRRLNTATPADSWIVIEKILAFDEQFQEELLCDGTTGYDALQRIGGLFVDPAGKAVLTTAFAEIADVTTDWEVARDQAKRAILNEVLISEVDRLARSAHEICQSDVRLRDHSLRGLTEATEGNACGIGMAEFALRRAVDAMDPRKTWMNEITAKTPEGGRTPIALETDREALAVAIAACVGVEVPTARVIRVRSTKDLELLLVSEAALPDVLATGRCEVVVPLAEIAFNEDG
ncbi:MAG: alpha-amylase family glycosyl hydrolase, partial [Actinomycetes bacterium]